MRIGDTVHYRSHGTPIRPDGTQAFTDECRAAIITAIPDNTSTLNLYVINPTGVFHHTVTQDPEYTLVNRADGTPAIHHMTPGTWHPTH